MAHRNRGAWTATADAAIVASLAGVGLLTQATWMLVIAGLWTCVALRHIQLAKLARRAGSTRTD